MSSSLMLVDGNNLLMRAFFAGKKTGMNHDGVVTGPLVIFINTLAKHIREENPARLAIAWDGGRSDKRLAIDQDYKGTREVGKNLHEFQRSVFELASQFCMLAGIYQQQRPGVEADDLIAAWWENETPNSARDNTITILSSDKDFLQLLGPNPHDVPTSLVRLSSAGTPTDRWTADRMLDEYGFRPVDWPLVTALTGDTVDHVPGVPGIGPKRATALLRESDWDLDKVLTHPRISSHAEQVRKSLRLVDLRTPMLRMEAPPPWRPTTQSDLNWPILINFLNVYGLTTVTQKLISNTLWAALPTSMPGRRLRTR
jgi:DNA polymerase-1